MLHTLKNCAGRKRKHTYTSAFRPTRGDCTIYIYCSRSMQTSIGHKLFWWRCQRFSLSSRCNPLEISKDQDINRSKANVFAETPTNSTPSPRSSIPGVDLQKTNKYSTNNLRAATKRTEKVNHSASCTCTARSTRAPDGGGETIKRGQAPRTACQEAQGQGRRDATGGLIRESESNHRHQNF